MIACTDHPVPDHADEDTEHEELEETRARISSSLRDLAGETNLVQQLTDSHQRGLGFLTAEAKAAISVQNAKDRRDQALRQKMGEPLGHGAIAAPGNINAVSVLDEVRRQLHRVVQDLTFTLVSQGVCSLHALRDGHTLTELIDHVRLLTWDVTDPDELDHVADILEPTPELDTALDGMPDAGGLVGLVRTFIDGNDRSHLRDPCPHCGRDTLVVFWGEQIITCHKSPTSVHLAPCTCSDPLCECKRTPVSYRHSWLLAKPAKSAHSWQALAGRLNLNRTISKEPNR